MMSSVQQYHLDEKQLSAVFLGAMQGTACQGIEINAYDIEEMQTGEFARQLWLDEQKYCYPARSVEKHDAVEVASNILAHALQIVAIRLNHLGASALQIADEQKRVVDAHVLRFESFIKRRALNDSRQYDRQIKPYYPHQVIKHREFSTIRREMSAPFFHDM